MKLFGRNEFADGFNPTQLIERVDSHEPSYSYSCQSGVHSDGDVVGWCTIETQTWVD